MATVKTIGGAVGRDFSTTQGWEDWAGAQLTSDQWGECYDDGTNLGAVLIGYWTTWPTVGAYPRLYTPLSERHNGKKTGGGAYLQAVGDVVFVFRLAYVRIEGLRIRMTGAGNGVSMAGDYVPFDGAIVADNCITYDSVLGGNYGVYVEQYDAGTVTTPPVVRNNIIYGNGYLGSAVGVAAYTATDGNAEFYNNTAYGCVTAGLYTFADAGFPPFVPGSTMTVTVKNNEFLNCGTDYLWDVDAATSSNNMSSDGTADDQGGSGHIVSVTASKQFMAVDDLRHRMGSQCLDAGTTIASFSTDCFGTARPLGSAWDMGAFEGAVRPPIPPGGVIVGSMMQY